MTTDKVTVEQVAGVQTANEIQEAFNVIGPILTVQNLQRRAASLQKELNITKDYLEAVQELRRVAENNECKKGQRCRTAEAQLQEANRRIKSLEGQMAVGHDQEAKLHAELSESQKRVEELEVENISLGNGNRYQHQCGHYGRDPERVNEFCWACETHAKIQAMQPVVNAAVTWVKSQNFSSVFVDEVKFERAVWTYLKTQEGQSDSN